MPESFQDPKGWTNVLATVPIFAGLGSRHLRRVAGVARIQRFHANTVSMRVGENGDDMHVVLDGSLSVRRSGLPDLTLPAGSFVGELALLDNGPRTATVLADGDVLTLTITRARFRKLLQTEPAIAIGIAEELARRLRSMQSVH
jgi:CRP/FNR family transcriptional regulator, cyclic AMP receptor protein